jgi:peroxiredoxin Q/BCP
LCVATFVVLVHFFSRVGQEPGTMKSPTLVITSAAALVLLLLAGGYSLLRGGNNAPSVGSSAPDFTLYSQDRQAVSLSALRGQWVVLYFYPKDFTSGCTVEAHNFERDLAEYQKRNAVILGVSVQDEKSHKQFCAKEGLNFKLLADTEKEVSKSYDSIINLGLAKLSSRHTFLIDPRGVIKKIWLDVDVKKHSQDVLAALDDFEKN